jgi:hypothetical protein
MGVAALLLPSVRVELHYLAFFPLTLLIGLFSRPKYPLFWFIRWGTGAIRMLVLVGAFVLLEIFGFLVFGWYYWGLNWTNAAHLLGFGCGVAGVLLLPRRIAMGARPRFS